LGEEVVDDMSANVMVDVVDPPVVPVNGRQATTEVAPFLQQRLQSKYGLVVTSEYSTLVKQQNHGRAKLYRQVKRASLTHRKEFM
jgi:hypothetical protein